MRHPEGWFCPSCQAYHAPHIDSCDVAHARDRFVCNICRKSADRPVRCADKRCMTMALLGGISSVEIH